MDNTVSEVRAFLRGETGSVSAFIEMPDGNWKSWDEVAREIAPILEASSLLVCLGGAVMINRFVSPRSTDSRASAMTL